MKRQRPLILDIDDDEAGRYVIARQLKQAGYDVIPAVNGQEGLKLAVSDKPDLILLDVRLPDIDGFEVCKSLRANADTADIPVVQMSASYVDTSSRVKGLENGADVYLTEPVEAIMLVATVNSLLRMKRAEQKVLGAAAQWQTTFDAIQDGVALLDETGRVVQSNNSFRQLLHVDSAAVHEMIAKTYGVLRASSTRTSDEHLCGEKTLHLTMDPVRNQQGECEGAVCILTDITERKLFESRLRHTAKLESIGVLAGGIAHDFNNLLTGILGNSSLILESLPQGSPEYEMTEQIIKASESAADLTRQILAYSGKGRFVMRAVDLSAIALESHALIRRLIPARIELKYDLQPNLPPIEADTGQMQQLIMNLIINAAESFEANGKGTVSVSCSVEQLDACFFRPGEHVTAGPYIVLSVSDTGSGMDEATQARIFDPFFTTKFAGRGLGLSAVHGILQGHKGLLRLHSRKGEGSTFRLYFPVAEQGRTAHAAPAGAATLPGSGTILVIDDESVVRNFAKTVLERRGYRVLVADNGESGVELFRVNHPYIDLVLLDFTMPVMNGEEALDHMHLISTKVPVILSSGFSQATAAEQFRGKELAGFLEKPYNASDLVEAVAAALSGKAKNQAM